MVALYAGLLERRLAGVASISGITPLRDQTTATVARTGGNELLSHAHSLLPRLGWFDLRPESTNDSTKESVKKTNQEAAGPHHHHGERRNSGHTSTSNGKQQQREFHLEKLSYDPSPS
jgi:hypothetical protein